MTKILVTGGAGYIGSHCVVKLLESGYTPVIYDDFSNSSPKAIDRIYQITGIRPNYYRGDIRDIYALENVFQENHISAVIHFAGKKSVCESERFPLLYYSVNVEGSICLLNLMEKYGVKKIVFSSTATVYGNCESFGVEETAPLGPINNYGKSKLIFENVLQEVADKDPNWSVGILRYFNPVGAHPSGLIGEDPNGIPANLMPFISQVAAGKRKKVKVFGNDYPTRDGTGSRDYIHVEDLVEAHVKTLNLLDKKKGVQILNLGTGKDTTVLELIKTFSTVNHITVPFEVVGRRVGDSAICFANPNKAHNILNWSATRTIEDMCRDTWRWQVLNPTGYKS